jgi:putative PIN family toxin of toxin-antitoxin system
VPTAVTADTNVYISAFISAGRPRQVIEAARRGISQLAVSDALLAELDRVLRHKFNVSDDSRRETMVALATFTTLVRPTRRIEAVPEDPDDNRVLECAVAAGSRYIVTGDRALLRLGRFEGVQIVRVADFMALIDP